MARKSKKSVRKGTNTSAQDFRLVTPMKNPLLPVPPNRALQPGFQKTVRVAYAFLTGAALGVQASSVLTQEAADYGLITSRGWSNFRLRSIKIWGPTSAPALTPEILINVTSSPSSHSGVVTGIAQYSTAVDVAATAYRPFIGWRYGRAIAATPWNTGSVFNIFTIEAASPSGEYIVDYEMVFA